jgi:hypothetical protein
MTYSLTATNDTINNQMVVFTWTGATAQGTLDFGDGSTPKAVFGVTGTIEHDYPTTGSFTATGYDLASNSLGTAAVTVSTINTRGASAKTEHSLMTVAPTSAPAATDAAFTASMTAATDRAFQAQVAGDANKRHDVLANGRHEWGSGSAVADTNLYRNAVGELKTDTKLTAAGDIQSTAGNVICGTAGKGLQVTSGTNAKAGSVTLNGSTGVVVSTTAVTANSLILLGGNGPAGTPSPAYVSAVTVGTSFTVKATASDTSVLKWMIVEVA